MVQQLAPLAEEVRDAMELLDQSKHETQEVLDYCADNGILPEIQVIGASKISETWTKVINKEARYRYVIDAATI